MRRADIVIAQTQKQQRSLKENFNLDSIILGSGYEIPPREPKNTTQATSIVASQSHTYETTASIC